MEKEKMKLISVLRRIARSAGYAAWVGREPDAARYCVSQYNKVLARLSEIEPNLNALFPQLADDTSPQIVRIAARELGAYFEDEAPEPFVFKFGYTCGSRHRHARHRGITVPLCD
jgi:hypothetical protein